MKKQLVKMGVLALLVSSVAGCANKLNPSSSSVTSNPPISSYPSSPSSQIDYVDPAIPDDPSYPTNVLDEYIEYTLVRNNTAYQISKFSPLYEGTESITLPDTYLGKTIVSIGSEAFLDVKTLSSIIIPDTITSIGSRAFKDCSNLTSIYLPSSILLIEENAFRGCSSLNIYSNYQIKPSGWNSKWNPNKRDIYWANSWVNDGEEIKSIFNSPFLDSYYDADLTPNNFFTYVDKGDYYEVSGLSLDYDGRSYVKIPDSYSSKPVKSIGLNAFAETLLSNIVIPNSITSIAKDAFLSTPNLDNVYLGNSVTTIEESAFSDCPSLRKFQVNSTNENYKSIDGVLFSKDDSTIIKYPEGKEISHYNISDTVTTISPSAFENSINLASIYLPDSVLTIGSNAFNNNSSLTIYTDATIKKTNWDPEWKKDGLVVYWKNSWSTQDNSTPVNIFESGVDESINDLELHPDDFLTFADKGDSMEVTGFSSNYDGRPYIKIPSYYSGKPVTTIGYSAFRSSKLANVIIPDSIISIGDRAFENCLSLINIIIPDSVVSVGNSAFAHCESLANIIIPDSVISIGNYSFEYCISLLTVIIPDSVISIGNSAFTHCESLVSIAIPSSVASIGNDFFSNCYSLVSVTLPDSVKSIGSSAFENCKSLIGFVIPEFVTTIGNYAFYGCESLVSIIIPDSVTFIGYAAFFDCTSLVSVTLSEFITSIGSSTFFGCTSLASIIIPNSVIEIEDSAFNGCTSLVNVTMSNSLATIGNGVFIHCTSLVSITLPASITTVGGQAFSYCSSLVSVIIPVQATIAWTAFSNSPVIVYTEAEFSYNFWNFTLDNTTPIKVYFAGQWSLVNNVPTPN